MLRLNHFHYFSRALNRETSEAYWHTALNNLALAMVFIFEPIYLYTLGYSLIRIMWFYAMVYFGYAAFVGFGAKFASHFGYKHAIFISNFFYVFYWLALFSIRSHPGLFFVAPFLFALQKSWFWPAYNADIALAEEKTQRGRELGVLYALQQAAFIVGPFLGGFLSGQFGFKVLFAASSSLMLFSVYPLFRSPEIFTRHQFHFRNLWQIMRRHITNFFGYWGYAEDLMIMSLWPVYMFVVVPNFFKLGTLSMVATAIGTVIMLYVGGLADRTDKRKLVGAAAVFYGVTWFIRFVARDLPSVLVLDSITKAGKDITNLPMVALTFDRTGQGSADFAIAYSVFVEFSLSVAKILTALAAIAILYLTGNIYLVFGLVGFMTMLYSLIK